MKSKRKTLPELLRDLKEVLRVFYEVHKTLNLEKCSIRTPEEITNEEVLKLLQETIASYRKRSSQKEKVRGEGVSPFLKVSGFVESFLLDSDYMVMKDGSI